VFTVCYYHAVWGTDEPAEGSMKVTRLVGMGIGVGVCGGFMGGLLRSRPGGEPVAFSPPPPAGMPDHVGVSAGNGYVGGEAAVRRAPLATPARRA